MSVPNTERPWAPAELDALEDALESLEHGDAPTLPGTLAPEQQQRIAERLASYRAIAGLSRELLRSYEAPASAISAALAEAHAAAAPGAGGGSIAAPLEPTTSSWWSRARRLWLVPAFATAGVGALVVVLSVTADKAERPETAAAPAPSSAGADGSIARAEQGNAGASSTPQLAMAEPDKGGEGKASFELETAPRGVAAESAEELRGRLRERKPTDGDEAQLKSELADDDAPAKDKRDNRRSAGTKRDVGPATPSPEPAPPAEPAPKGEPKAPKQPSTPPSTKPSKPAGGGAAPGTTTGGADGPSSAALGDLLVRADRARRQGDCDAARRDYAQVIAKGDRKQRARAKAGTALCLEREGAEASAGDLIAGARLDDPGIDAWIADERGAARQ